MEVKEFNTLRECQHKGIIVPINKKTHGLSNHTLYYVWDSMKQRCSNSNNKSYKNYGGRGITICDRWVNNFLNFYEDMREGYKKGLQLDRIDNNGNYEPSNCRWVTNKQNQANKGGRIGGSSVYKGVTKIRDGKWTAQIKKDGKVYRLGYFTCEREAAKSYDVRAKIIFGEYAGINFS